MQARAFRSSLEPRAGKIWLASRTWLAALIIAVIVSSSGTTILRGSETNQDVEETTPVAELLDDKDDSLALFSSSLASQENNNVKCGSHLARTLRRLAGDRIAGGYEANEGEFPSFVHVRVAYKNKKVKNCGGTIVSERLVISAAHCFEGKRNASKKVEILAGSTKLKSGRKYYASQVCAPSGVQSKSDDSDYAVLITETPINFNELVQPACLPYSQVDYSTQAHVVGFGLTAKWPKYARAQKLQVMPVKRTEYCEGFLVGPDMMCFISSNHNYLGDACEGDSGGPVYVLVEGRQTLVGIVSSGVNTCTEGYKQAGIYMNVFRLMHKLRELVRECNSRNITEA